MTTVELPDLPVESVAVRRTLYVPAAVNVCVGLASADVVPSPKSHANVSSSPSASSEPSLLNWTVSGAGPESLSAVARATGVRVPLA